MSTFNGIGTRFNAVSGPDKDGNSKATLWITFLFIPIVPLWKAEIKREIALPLKDFKYQVIQKIPLDKKEILTTYLYGWILIPLLLVAPFIFLVPEVTNLLGIAPPPARNLIKGDSLTWHDWLMIFSLIYLAVVAIKLYEKDLKRGLPENFKDDLQKQII